MKTVDFFCYYNILPEKLDEFRTLAKTITKLYRSQPEYHSFKFSARQDPDRKNTVMESGTFDDRKNFNQFQAKIESEYPEIFRELDSLITGGLKARKYEFFTDLE